MFKTSNYFTTSQSTVKKATVGSQMKATKIRQEQSVNDAMKFMLEKRKAVVGGKKKKPVKKVGGSLIEDRISKSPISASVKRAYSIWKAGRDGHTFPYTLYKNFL